MTHFKDIAPQIVCFFVLAGVRISAFVSSDDKKPLQKSIVSFLNSQKHELGPSHKATQQQFKENNHLSSSSQILPSRSQKPKESDEKKTFEGPQQSFFQRARAKRLQVQAAATSARQQAGSGTGSTSVMAAHKSAALDEADNDHACEAVASTSGGVGLSCPVCFSRVETADLSLFNRHIDQCLGMSSAQKPSRLLRKDSRGSRVEEAEVSEELNPIDPPGEGGVASTSTEMAQSVSGNDNAASEQPPERKSPALVCPICLLTQDNDDLINFNRHVDLCLNQQVLHELQLETSSPINPPSVPNSKAVGECVCVCEYELDGCLQAKN